MNIYQSYRKDLSWLHFYDDLRVDERQQVLDLAHLVARNSTPDMTTVFHAKLYGRFIEIESKFKKKRLLGTNPVFQFLRDFLNNENKVLFF